MRTILLNNDKMPEQHPLVRAMLIHQKHRGLATIRKPAMRPLPDSKFLSDDMTAYHLELARQGGNLIQAMRTLRRSGTSLGVAVRAIESLSMGFEVDVEIPKPSSQLENELLQNGITARRV